MPSGNTHAPPDVPPSGSARKHSAKVSHCAPQGRLSAVTEGHVALVGPPSGPGSRPGRKPPEPHDPMRQRTAKPSQTSPGAAHRMPPHVPDAAQPMRATVCEQGPGMHPRPGVQSTSFRQKAPASPSPQVAPPGSSTPGPALLRRSRHEDRGDGNPLSKFARGGVLRFAAAEYASAILGRFALLRSSNSSWGREFGVRLKHAT